MRIAVIGTGGVGGYYGAMLARAGEDVIFVARGAHLDAMRANGLRVKTSHVGEFTLPVQATSQLADIGPVDLVLFCVKTYDTDSVAPSLHRLIGPETVVLSLQNGIEKEARLGRLVGNEPIVGAAAYVSSKIAAPGVIQQVWVQKLYFGELNGQPSPRTAQLLKTFTQAEIAAEIPSDIQAVLWAKFLAVSAFAAVSCVTRPPAGIRFPEIETAKSATELLQRVMTEGYTVARANGVAWTTDFVDQSISQTAAAVTTARPSMYYDLEAGRRLELEDLVGAVVRYGEKVGVPTPLTLALYTALKPYAKE